MLKKLKMPKPKMIEMEEGEMDMEMPEGEEMSKEMSEEMPEDMEGEEEMEESKEKGSPALAKFSDEDLLSEVKKRGLMSQLETEMGEESAEDAYV